VHVHDYIEPPLEDPLTTWRREASPPPRPRGLDTAPVDWSAEIDRRIADEHSFMSDIVAQALSELMHRQREALEDALRPLRVELAELRLSNCQLRASNAELREQMDTSYVTDLPSLPLRN
jgi:hypothetical protein